MPLSGWEITFRSRVRGPISSGRMARDAADYSHDVADAIAGAAKATWLNNLHWSIRHPTGYYTSHIRKHEITPTRYRVDDSGVIYGPWLESGEYTPRRRFAGYFSKQRAEEEVQAKRGTIARRILSRYRASGRLI